MRAGSCPTFTTIRCASSQEQFPLDYKDSPEEALGYHLLNSKAEGRIRSEA
ncbi:MAG: hypothetical protein H7201_06005 [Candidatus Saccharibacteria bacterium]|nr:hypothetical protein [Microbacteriaceae bacterium]